MYAPPLIIVAILLKIVVALHKCCPSPKWVYQNGSCYLIHDEPLLSWSDSRKMCQSLGGDLVLPRSQEENDFVFHQLLRGWPKHYSSNAWLRCYFKDNKWNCLDHTNYINLNTELEKWGDCGMMRVNGFGEWRGMDCSELRRSICHASAAKQAGTVTGSCSATPHNQPRCLTNHTLTELAIKIPRRCCLACLKNPACRSFNLKGDMCQLNGVVASQVDEEYFTIVPDCTYYEYE